jgi:RecA/RadA recombinase
MAKKKKAARSSSAETLQLSTGCTLLNCALSDDPSYGLETGRYYLLVGDSGAGKTWLTHSILAEAAHNPAFDDYSLIYDDVEGGALMNVAKFFGKKTAMRIQPPRTTEDGLPICSETIEDMYDNVTDCMERGPCIYITDSVDALSSNSSLEKFQENKKRRQSGKDATGSYGDGKAKINSENLRNLITMMKKGGSLVVFVCQSRDNLGFGFETKTRSGGRALKFYATSEIWMSVKKKLRQEVGGVKMSRGIISQVDIKKNRQNGNEPACSFTILNSLGIDDITSSIDFLVESELWSESSGKLTAAEFDFAGKRSKLIKSIEAEDDVALLQAIVGRQWNEIREKMSTRERRSRYVD